MLRNIKRTPREGTFFFESLEIIREKGAMSAKRINLIVGMLSRAGSLQIIRTKGATLGNRRT